MLSMELSGPNHMAVFGPDASVALVISIAALGQAYNRLQINIHPIETKCLLKNPKDFLIFGRVQVLSGRGADRLAPSTATRRGRSATSI